MAKINGQLWEISFVNQIQGGTHYTGITLCSKRRIQIGNWPAKWIQAENVIHEVLHAFVCAADGYPDNRVYNNTDDQTKEGNEAHKGIYFAALKLREFIQDPTNFYLIDWIRNQVPPEPQPPIDPFCRDHSLCR